MSDRAFAMSLAAAATAGLALGYSYPLGLTLYLAAINCVAIWRWHHLDNWLGFALGATFGNATELAADTAGLWIHANRDFFGITPAYMLLCYPLLWIAGPHLLTLPGSHDSPVTSGSDAANALVIWALHTGLCCRYGASVGWLLAVNLLAAGALLFRFRESFDIRCAVFGGILGMVWEIPCTWSGAWRFPEPNLAGLIPGWLPIAYAVFFVALNRVRLYACQKVVYTKVPVRLLSSTSAWHRSKL